MTSSAARRASVRRSASGAGLSPFLSSSARTNASTGVRTHFGSLSLAGTAGRVGAMNAQCGSYSAPSDTQRFRVAFCSAVSFLCDDGGGMRCSSSSARSRRLTNSDSSSLPGAMAPRSIAAARSSKRSLALRAAESGPWQEKHVSARIGRMSRLNFSGASAPAAGAASPRHKTKQARSIGRSTSWGELTFGRASAPALSPIRGQKASVRARIAEFGARNGRRNENKGRVKAHRRRRWDGPPQVTCPRPVAGAAPPSPTVGFPRPFC